MGLTVANLHVSFKASFAPSQVSEIVAIATPALADFQVLQFQKTRFSTATTFFLSRGSTSYLSQTIDKTSFRFPGHFRKRPVDFPVAPSLQAAPSSPKAAGALEPGIDRIGKLHIEMAVGKNRWGRPIEWRLWPGVETWAKTKMRSGSWWVNFDPCPKASKDPARNPPFWAGDVGLRETWLEKPSAFWSQTWLITDALCENRDVYHASCPCVC